jgi:hypothetical protein
MSATPTPNQDASVAEYWSTDTDGIQKPPEPLSLGPPATSVGKGAVHPAAPHRAAYDGTRRSRDTRRIGTGHPHPVGLGVGVVHVPDGEDLVVTVREREPPAGLVLVPPEIGIVRSLEGKRREEKNRAGERLSNSSLAPCRDGKTAPRERFAIGRGNKHMRCRRA